jgi:uncharacterized protein (TIGR03663 family)
MDSFVASRHLMKHALIIVCWIGVLAAGVFLRFDGLADRPFHADEATGARITAQRLESGGARFDPRHHHGPLLGGLAAPLSRLRGETGWRDMSKHTLRLLPAFAGVLLVLVPLLGRRRYGDAPMLLAAALLATSPLLAYYSRMFIHEMLLALAGMAALFFLTNGWRLIVAGFLVGLMYATKETFVISMLAWSGAGLCLMYETRTRIECAAWLRLRVPVIAALAVLILTAGFFYTDAFRNPRGAIDAVRTFFVYENVEGHDKSPFYYLQLLMLPHKSGGLWWFGTPVLLLALCAVAMTFRKEAMAAHERVFVRFIGWSALFHFLIYSLISYKNPWLACLPWAHVCLLAGFAFSGIMRLPVAPRIAIAALAVVGIVTQFKQARAATGRLASDARNPFAYVPTRRDVESLESWLARLRDITPAGTLEPVAVIGGDYWPLPWYLRAFDKTGYWNELPPDLEAMPLVFSMPDTAEVVSNLLTDTHVALPRGLRPDVPVILYLRKDIWELWMNDDPR